MNFMRSIVPPLFGGLLLGLLGGCETLGYQWQAASGHLRLMHARQPIEGLLNDPATPPELRAKLQTAQAARRFASDVLGLPDNDSYSEFVAVDGPGVVYNVVAAPEFSLTPRTWCFPIAGCVSYRGYFSRHDAQTKAAQLQREGFDVVVNVVPAYSTLGWFDDPLPSTVLAWPEDDLARLIFHELAHQALYVKGDTAFNESFASAVGELGLRDWRDHRGRPAPPLQPSRQARLRELVRPTREALRDLYDSGLPAEQMRAEKAALLQALQALYSTQQHTLPGYAHWFAGLNNARLAGLDDYTVGLAPFLALHAQCAGDWPCFHQRSRQLSTDADARKKFLNRE